MDPDATLAELRTLVAEARALIIRLVDATDRLDLEDLTDEIVNTFDGLDNWLRNGGFLPNDWRVGNE